MKRRDFMRLSGLGAAGAFLLNGFPASSMSYDALFKSFNCELFEDRTLVLIQLKGGNDGLNTIIPIDQYDQYVNIRPDIHISDTGSNGFINLDSTLPLFDQIGLHPSLLGFKSLYDAGKMNVIQAVSYPNQNRSHFRSTDLYMTGEDGNAGLSASNEGWMYRFLTSKYNQDNFQDPLGLQLGSKKPSVGFHTEGEHQVSINISGQDPQGFYSLISGIGNEFLTNVPNSHYGANLDHIMGVELGMNIYAQRITDVFNSGTNSVNVTYPDTDLANQLKTVARLISGGSKTKIFLVELSGFDTHNNQIDLGQSHLGKHADLLTELSEAVVAFQADMEGLGKSDDVVAATFSEFGRKAVQNGSYGTDHGTLAPMFVFGSNITAGVSGTNVDLSTIQNDQLTGYQHDYRQVFSTLIQDWLGGTDYCIQSSFPTYASTIPSMLPIIDQAVPDGCLNDVLNVQTISELELSVAPNPARDVTYIQTKYVIDEVIVLNANGQQVLRQDSFDANDHSHRIELDDLSTGNYFVKILSSSFGQVQKKIIVVK